MTSKLITRSLLATLLLGSVATSALAEAPYPPETPFVSTKTRAQVIDELKQARAAGEVPTSNQYPIDKTFVSTKTRAQVIAELKQAEDDGEMLVGDEYPVERANRAVARIETAQPQTASSQAQANRL